MMTAPVENFRLKAALSYAARGWRVFPLHWPMIGSTGTRCSCGEVTCKNVGKHPRTAQGFKDGSTDPEVIKSWWGKWPAANIGIATGAVSGIYVIDVDVHKGGAMSLGELCDAYGQLPETVEAETGSGGTHIVFAHPAGKVMGNTAGKLGEGIDTRGDGGYIVAAPSQHPCGNRYVWKSGSSPEESGLAQIPIWLMAHLVEPASAAKAANRPPVQDDAARHWLGKAIGMAREGTRSATAQWLACQLRDNGVPWAEAESTMAQYARACPGSDYTEREAIATAKSAYKTPPREPARGKSSVPVRLANNSSSRGASSASNDPLPEPVKPAESASAELRQYLGGVTSGAIKAVPLPWAQTSRLTQALLPGSVLTICGDPGVGKTFLVLQGLQYWHDAGVQTSALFVEKNRRFHTHRLLAQLEGAGKYVDYEWLKEHGTEVDLAMERHAARIDELGACIDSKPESMLTLDGVFRWASEKAKAGSRIVVVDPITALSAGPERWAADDQFMIQIQQEMSRYGSSLVLVTHPKKGNRQGSSTGHDQAGGAAYFRFPDTVIWVSKPKKPKNIIYQSLFGAQRLRCGLFFEIHKARNGPGGGQSVAFLFGEGLKFAEQGLVIADAPEMDAQDAIANAPLPPASKAPPPPAAPQDLDFGDVP